MPSSCNNQLSSWVSEAHLNGKRQRSCVEVLFQLGTNFLSSEPQIRHLVAAQIRKAKYDFLWHNEDMACRRMKGKSDDTQMQSVHPNNDIDKLVLREAARAA